MLDDAELCKLALGGDRQAFSRIVERYQALVSAICYSGVGDLSSSEDLAQETFVTAWTRLAQLRDSAKLKQWLCGIARNLTYSHRRERDRDVLSRAAPNESALARESIEPAGADRAITREEERILRQALDAVPETYREPLILYYREGHSVAAVAGALDLTEDAVKQRLSRGRRLLKREVAAFVESALSRTGPTVFFAAGVIAALPAAGPQTASAAAVTAKGASASKGLLAGGLAGAMVGSLVGLAGGIIGTRASIKSTRSPRERSFMIKVSFIVWIYVLVLIALEFLLVLFSRKAFASFAWQVTIWACYVAGLLTLIFWVNSRQRRIRCEDGTESPPSLSQSSDRRADNLQRMTPPQVLWMFGGSIFGPIVWIVPVSLKMHDWVTPLAACGAAAVAFVACVCVTLKNRSLIYHAGVGAVAAIGAVNLAVVNLRWRAWSAESSFLRLTYDTPRWAVNLAIVLFIVGLVVLLVYRGMQVRRLPGSNAPPGERQTP